MRGCLRDMIRKILHLKELAPPPSNVTVAEKPKEDVKVVEEPDPASLAVHLGHFLLLFTAYFLITMIGGLALEVRKFPEIYVLFGIVPVSFFLGIWMRKWKTPPHYSILFLASIAFAGVVFYCFGHSRVTMYEVTGMTFPLLLGSLLMYRPKSKVTRKDEQITLPPAGPFLADRLIYIDPADIETPPALNLFDFGLDRIKDYSPTDQEKLVNGAIAMYEFMFGALLGAEMTNRQGVIFRYLARLMMVVPNPDEPEPKRM